MDELPDDLMKVAREVASNLSYDAVDSDGWGWHGINVEVVASEVARVLAAERERCAEMARDTTRSICPGDFFPSEIGQQIAAAILAA